MDYFKAIAVVGFWVYMGVTSLVGLIFLLNADNVHSNTALQAEYERGKEDYRQQVIDTMSDKGFVSCLIGEKGLQADKD